MSTSSAIVSNAFSKLPSDELEQVLEKYHNDITPAHLKILSMSSRHCRLLVLVLYRHRFEKSIIDTAITQAIAAGRIHQVAVLKAYLLAHYPPPRIGAALFINSASEFIAIARSALANGRLTKPRSKCGMDPCLDPYSAFADFMTTTYPDPTYTELVRAFKGMSYNG